MRYLYYHLGRMETVFSKKTRVVIARVRLDANSLIGVRQSASNIDKVQDTFQRIVDLMPQVQDAALADMQIDVPSVPWK